MNFNLHGEVLLRGIKTGNYVNHQHNSSQEPAIEMRQYLFYSINVKCRYRSVQTKSFEIQNIT